MLQISIKKETLLFCQSFAALPKGYHKHTTSNMQMFYLGTLKQR